MKCPLFIMNDTRAQLGEETEIGDCLGEGCAWWNNTNGMCAVLQLGKSVYFMGLTLALMEEKMPCTEQFTK